MTRPLSAAIVLASAFGCVTPMSEAEQRSLTTCHETSLAKMRKSLVKSGYEILGETANGLEALRVAHRLRVERLDEDSFRFSVRIGEGDMEFLEERRAEAAALQREACGEG